MFITCRAVQIGITYQPVAKDAMENGDIDITVQACGISALPKKNNPSNNN